MTLLLNRATLRAYGGKSASTELRVKSWAFVNRRLMARKLGQVAGIKVDVEKLEKNLRFLENRNVIRISRGKIYHTAKSFDLGEEGSGVVDLAKTLANVVSKEVDPSIFSHLLRKVPDLAFIHPRLGRLAKARISMAYPLLKLRALETTAKRILIKLNEREAEKARQTTAQNHTHTAENIKIVEKEMARVRAMSMEEICKLFNPSKCKPYRQMVYPAGGFDINPKHKQNKARFALVVSDLHLNTESHPKTEDLLRFFALAHELRAEVVLNGDIYDFFVWRSTLMKIREANPYIMNAIDRMANVLYIVGNHDRAMKKVAPSGKFGLNVHVQETYYGNHVYFEHGHQSDRYNQDDANIGLYLVKIGSWLQKKFLIKKLWPRFMEWMEVIGRTFVSEEKWKANKINSLIERIRAVVRDLEAKGQGPFTNENPLIYVRGHDHGAGYWFTIQDIIKAINEDTELAGKVRYCTTGSWKGEESYCVALDFTHSDRVYPYPFIWKPAYDQFVDFKSEA